MTIRNIRGKFRSPVRHKEADSVRMETSIQSTADGLRREIADLKSYNESWVDAIVTAITVLGGSVVPPPESTQPSID